MILKDSERQLSEHQKTIDEQFQQLEDQKKENMKLKQKFDEQFKLTNDIKEQLEIQKNVNNNLKEKYDQLNEENTLSLTYTAAIGSVLSKMLWKTSKNQEAIQTYVETGTLNQFLNLVNRTIISFDTTYKDNLPEVETYEFQFILSLLGICINIMAQNIGREFVLERDLGDSLVNNIILYFGNIPMSTIGGPLLKRMILMILYNLTFTKQGTYLIESCEMSVGNIMKCFDSHHTAEIHSIAIFLIHQLLKDSQTNEFRLKVREQLSQHKDDFEKLIKTADSKTKEVCTQLFEQISNFNDVM
ncbi:heat shock factor 2-binding protein-like isoform X2 [Chironomus tepperi]|uniref:heat shock factor 2-binding protein-like isoform X2 n=1 Tax=Chironomus tepperi TaxID=113505 RepID=UPI00391F1894